MIDYSAASPNRKAPCLVAALEEAKCGRTVFPVPPGTKMSYKAAKNSNGARWGAAKDLAEIERDWKRWPLANIGIPTGKDNGFFVVETDCGETHGGVDGEKSLKQLTDKFGGLPSTRTAKSPSGGIHRQFNNPVDLLIRNSTSKLGPGIDVRGEGGMVVVPPSQRDGKFYEWLNNGPIADAPQWLLDLIARVDVSQGSPNVVSSEALCDQSFVAEVVSHIPDRFAVNHDDWRHVGLGIYAAYNGSEDGKKLFDWFSRKCPEKYNNPKYTIDECWRQFHRSPPNRTGLANLMARADPNWMDRKFLAMNQLGRDIELSLPVLDGSLAASEAPDYCLVLTVEAAGQATFAGREGPDRVKFQTVVKLPPKPSMLHWHGESQDVHIQWLIKDLMQQTGAGLLSGQWGTFKTFMALLLAGCVMTGQNFVDYRIRRKGGVLFIAKEGKAGLRLRLQVMIEHSLGIKDGVLLPFAWADPPVYLMAQGSDSLIKLAREAQEEMRRRFNLDLVLIIIDTMGAAAGFHREGEGSEGNIVMNELHKLAGAVNCFVLAVDHFGKDIEAGTRGVMTKEDRSDMVLALIGERALTGEMSNLRMGVRKVRDGEVGRIIPFRTEVINCGVDEDGDAITSRIIHWELDRSISPERQRRPSQATTIFSAAFHAALNANGSRVVFPGFNAVLESEVRQTFIEYYMNNGGRDGDRPNRTAAGQRWRTERDRATIQEKTIRSQTTHDGRTFLCLEMGYGSGGDTPL